MSTRAKERFKVIYDTSAFEPVNGQVDVVAQMKGAKEQAIAIDKKIALLKMQRSNLRNALVKKFRRNIADKMLNLLDTQYN